jgi:hypothetical protein
MSFAGASYGAIRQTSIPSTDLVNWRAFADCLDFTAKRYRTSFAIFLGNYLLPCLWNLKVYVRRQKSVGQDNGMMRLSKGRIVE